MPVTAKLSRKFYERLGDDIAGELVDWFNAVDTTYQSQLREINDLNWERLKAETRAQGAELLAEMRTQNAELRKEIASLETRMMKWMFIYWSGTMLTLAAFILGR